MRTLLAGAIAAATLGTVVTPAHAVSSCLNNPDILVLAAAGTSASCEIGLNPPPLAWAVVVATGSVDIDLLCTTGFSDSRSATAVAVVPGVILPFNGTCTLTLTATAGGTTAVGTMV